MECSKCGDDFTLTPTKPGLIHHCINCATDIPKLGGNMIWDHKTAPYIEIKAMDQAKAFARLQRRHGAGPLRSITQSKAGPGMPDNNGGHPLKGEATPGQIYVTRLGEKRSIKR